MKITALLMILLAPAFAPGHGHAAPRDIEGWRGARWNMTEAELERTFGNSLAHLPGRWIYGNAYATRALGDVRLGNLRFRAIFQMNADSGRLQQILLEPLRRQRPDAVFSAALGELRKTYGPPSRSCNVPRSGGGPLSVEIRWRFPTTTVHLVFFNFHSRAMTSEDPNIDPDPLTPYYKTQRNTPGFLPRRAVVRFHATARTDLMPATAGCR